MSNQKIYKNRYKPYATFQKGFTLIELILVMSIFAVLAGIATVNLFSFQHKAQLDSTLNMFIADLKGQQTKAMAGYANGEANVENYGINFDSSNYRYVLFKGTYSSSNTANFSVSYPNSIQITTTFPNSQLIFTKGSGELSGYATASATVTLQDTQNNEQKTIQFNRYGVITSVN